jgi:OOP family OmpA-OmpF porin
MKKFYLNALILLLVAFVAIGCGKKAVQKPMVEVLSSRSLDEKLQSGEYQPKVSNFLIIMDTSGTMQDSFKGKSKMAHAKNFIQNLDKTIPDINLTGGMRTLGQYFSNSTRLAYGMKSYARGDLSKASANLNFGGMTPLGSAISAGTNDLRAAQGNTAVIVVSDGIDTEKTSEKSAQAMKARYGDRLCIYTVLVGDNERGRSRMAQIAQEGGCGFATTALALSANEKMLDFVNRVFLEKAPVKAEAPPVKAPPPIGDSDGDGVPDNLDKCPGTPKGATVDARGCWTYEAKVLFGFDSDKIRSEAHPMLDEAISIMKQNSQLRVRIEGHTCDIGPDAYNQKLSERRAKAIRDYFVDNGISINRMEMQGLGEMQPAYPNNSKENRAKNRRVELSPID